MNILLVEKNKVVRNSINHILSKEGYKVTDAENGQIAYDYLTNEKFDILITNITLPYYSGYELISYLRNEANDPNTKIVVISDNFTADNMNRLYKMGMDEMIEKPFAPMELIIRIEKLSEQIRSKNV